MHDVLTDIICGATVACGKGGSHKAHEGMLQAAREMVRRELHEVVALSQQYRGYELLVVGHSLGEFDGWGWLLLGGEGGGGSFML